MKVSFRAVWAAKMKPPKSCAHTFSTAPMICNAAGLSCVEAERQARATTCSCEIAVRSSQKTGHSGTVFSLSMPSQQKIHGNGCPTFRRDVGFAG
jgi:hypothetical protein